MARKFAASISPARWRLILNVAGVLILLAGYTMAVMIFRAQDRLDQKNASQMANEADPLSPLDSRSGTRQVELYYGKSGLLLEGVLEWFQTMTHGKPLAKTILVLSSGAAIGCFIVAARRV